MSNEQINLESLRQLFEKSADVQFQQFMMSDNEVTIVKCEGMVDDNLLYGTVIQKIQSTIELLQKATPQQSSDSKTDVKGAMEKNSDKQVNDREPEQNLSSSQRMPSTPTQQHQKQTFEQQVMLPQIQKVTQLEACIALLFSGYVLIYLGREQELYATNISKKPNRNPEETNVEALIKGPRDNFVEDLSMNIALIRKRLLTNSLCVEKMELGERSKTSLAILYFDDIVDKKILQELKNQLQKVEVDIVFSIEPIMDEVNKKSGFFPRTDYTGRADFAIQSLARGRFIILVDGVSYAVITPINIFILIKSGEDNEQPFINSSFSRALRLVGLLIGLLLPAFWLALMTFHQNQLPLKLLATVVQANIGLPFPTALEMLLMLMFFELFREAGVRLPTVMGNTIGVVGGLIIGDAAIRSGITSPATVVVIALSTISTFTLVNQSLVSTVSILRILFILASAVFGLFGFFISLYFLMVFITSIKIFGVPYVNIGADLNWKNLAKSLFRMNQSSYKKRPKMLKTQDDTRNKKAK